MNKVLTLKSLIVYILLMIPVFSSAQEPGFKVLTLDEAITLAHENNVSEKNAGLEVLKSRKAIAGAIDLSPTEFTYQYGEINGPFNDRYIEINQDFGSLLFHINQIRTARKVSELNKTEYEILKNEITAQVKSAYYYWIYLFERLKIQSEINDLFKDISGFAELQYNLGEIDPIEKVTLTSKKGKVELQYRLLLDDIEIALNKLKQIIYKDEDYIPDTGKFEIYMIDRPLGIGYAGGLMLSQFEKKAELESLNVNSNRSIFFPGISAGYFTQEIETVKGLNGWQIGLSFPILPISQTSALSQAKIEREIAINNLENKKFEIEKQVDMLLFELNKCFKQIVYYKEYALIEADTRIKVVTSEFEKEEIDYLEYIEGIAAASEIKLEYLDLINNYNQIAFQLELYAN